MKDLKKSLDDRRLNAIVDPWAGRGVQPDTEICAEDFADRYEHGVAGLDIARLDPGKKAMIDSGGRRQLTDRQASVDPEAPDVEANAPTHLGCRAARCRATVGAKKA